MRQQFLLLLLLKMNKMGTGRILAIGTMFVTVVAVGDTHCPEVCTCPSLYRADCYSASLTHIPINLASDVRFLNATGNDFISLRKGAFNVNHIKLLDLSNSSISEIENDALKELEYLIFLYLSRNRIVSLDQYVFTINRRLEVLKLDNNMLDFPQGRPFLSIPSLKSLDISSCSIQSLPEETFVRLPSLEELTLAQNNLQELPRKVFLYLKSLKYLYLSHNLLTALHGDLFVMSKKLVILDLSNNKLQTLHPQMFTFLQNVEILKLTENLLKNVDFDVFAPLINLENLYLDKNALNVLNGSQFSVLNNLTHLDISGNKLDSSQLLLMCHLKNLTYLKVTDNRLACDCAVWELWNWSLEKGMFFFSTCDEPDFEFSVKNFESFQINNSCNATVCGIRNVTDFSEQILFPMYLYGIISASLLFVSVACVVTFCVVAGYRKDFFKRRNNQISINDYHQNTASPVGRHHECFAPAQLSKMSEDLHRHERLRKNSVKVGKNVSRKKLPTAERGNIRHSYNEGCVSSVVDDDMEWSNADTVSSNKTSSVFLQIACSHPQKLEKSKNLSISEPKLKVCRKDISTKETGLHTPVNPLSISTLECQTSFKTPRFKNVRDASSLEHETANFVERL
jgi:Leucine-rich repeat (LRR) protein